MTRIEEGLSCDLCGDDKCELRELAHVDASKSIRCRPCYGGPHEEHEWNDFPIAQGAAE